MGQMLIVLFNFGCKLNNVPFALMYRISPFHLVNSAEVLLWQIPGVAGSDAEMAGQFVRLME